MPRFIQLMPDESSVLHHNVSSLPVAIRTISLSEFTGYDIITHWNDDITLITILSGSAAIQVDHSLMTLHAGDLIMINKKHRHHLYSTDGSDCSFICVLFHPNLFLNNLEMATLTNNYNEHLFPGYKFIPADSADCHYLRPLIDQMVSLNSDRPPYYELRILGNLHLILARCLASTSIADPFDTTNGSPDEQAFYLMLDYIHHHYRENISMEELAAAGGVCKSRCYTIFQKLIQCTPVEYINNQRLMISRNYLADQKTSIAAVATICGFNSQSYYSKLFRKKFKMTPRQFRDKNARS